PLLRGQRTGLGHDRHGYLTAAHAAYERSEADPIGLCLAQLELARDQLRDLHHETPRLELVVEPAELRALGSAAVAHEHELQLGGRAQIPGPTAVRCGVIAGHKPHIGARTRDLHRSPFRWTDARRARERAGRRSL